MKLRFYGARRAPRRLFWTAVVIGLGGGGVAFAKFGRPAHLILAQAPNGVPQRKATHAQALIVCSPTGESIQWPRGTERVKVDQDALVAQRRRVLMDDDRACWAVSAPAVSSQKDNETEKLPLHDQLRLLVNSLAADQLNVGDPNGIPVERLRLPQRRLVERIISHAELGREGQIHNKAGSRVFLNARVRHATYYLPQSAAKVPYRSRLDGVVPSEPAIGQPPLRGSFAWYASPEMRGAWGQEYVSFPRQAVGLKKLALLINEQTSWKVTIGQDVPDTSVELFSRNMNLRRFLWALKAATGTDLAVDAQSKEVKIFRRELVNLTDAEYEEENETMELLEQPGPGIPVPSMNEAVKALLEKQEDFRPQRLDRSIGWRMLDLPLLYQDFIMKARVESNGTKGVSLADSDSDSGTRNTGLCYWVQGVRVSISALSPGGGGGEVQFFLPAA